MRKSLALWFLCAYATLAFCQSDTGVQPYESCISINAYECINPGNLDIVLTVPVRAKGGPIPLSLNLSVNSQIYRGPNNTGAQSFVSTALGGLNAGNLTLGQPYWGGLLAGATSSMHCTDNTPTTAIFATGIVDGTGGVHPVSFNWDSAGCLYPPVDLFTTDNTGMEIVTHTGDPTITVYNKSGISSTCTWTTFLWSKPPCNIIDTHGNTVTRSLTSSVVITDQLTTTPVLTATSAATPTLTYTDGTGAQQTVTLTVDSTTKYLSAFNTAGACNYGQGGGTANAPLYATTKVSYPVGGAINLTWEKTPANNYNGRLSTIQIPQGATYTHTYSGGTNGEGLWCDANSISMATLAISNGAGTWTFARTVGSGTYPNRTITTTLTKPDGSKVVYTAIGDKSPILTSKIVKDADGTTVLDTMTYCFDSTIASCNSTPPTQHPAVVRAYHTVPGVTGNSEVDMHYDTVGNVTEKDDYDFGPTLVRKTLAQFGSWSGSACVAIGSSIQDRPCDVQVQDASSNVLAHSRFAYNSDGDLLNEYDFSDATNFLTTATTYNTNGTIATRTAPDGVQITFAYNGTGGCNTLVPTSATNSLGTVSETWDCNGAVPLTTTDLNNLVTTTTYGDALYRVTQVADNGGQAPMLYTYPSATRSSVHMTFNGGASISDTTTTLDTLGRVLSVQHQTAPGSANYDTLTSVYNTTGYPTSISTACTTTIGASCATHAVEYTYDGLGRTKTETTKTATPGVLTYTYPTGDVKAVLTPAPTGENSKIVQIEMDGLGRTTRVCSVITSGLSGGGSCGERTAATGYLTKYTLDALDRPTQISRNAQAGQTPVNTSATYDMLGRTTQTTKPESGTANMYYDTAHGPCTNPLAGHLNETVDSAGNVICIATFDAMGRVTGINSPSGPDSSKTPTRLFGYLHGQLNFGYTCDFTCVTLITQQSFTRDIYGRLTSVTQNSPGLGNQSFSTTVNYWDNGAIQSLAGIPGVSDFSYGIDGEGRLTSATSGATSIVSSVVYDAASNPLTINYANGDKDDYTYDPASQDMTLYKFTVGTGNLTDTGTLTWNPNGTLKQLSIADNITSADTQTCTTAHDDLVRITSWNCGALWNESYAYSPDYAGNVTKSGSLSFAPGYTPATNRMLSPWTYDANGNILHDANLSINYTWEGYGGLATSNGNAIVNDAFGNTIQKTVSGVNTYIVQSPIGLLGTASSLTAYSNIRIPLPGGGMNKYTASSVDRLYHSDFTGSARLGTNRAARTLFSAFSYGPMGELYVGTAAASEYEGTFQDTQSGLNDFDATRYSGSQGRTISPTGGANGYVKDNSPF